MVELSDLISDKYYLKHQQTFFLTQFLVRKSFKFGSGYSVLLVMWYYLVNICFYFFLLVNVDEWMKSANSLSPNDMEGGEFFLLDTIRNNNVQLLCVVWLNSLSGMQ